MKNLRKYYPGSEIHYFCRSAAADFLRSTGLVDQVIEADKSGRKKWKASLAQLQSHSYELVLCPHESWRSATAVKNLKAKKSIGFYKWWNAPFFDLRIRRPMEMPEPLRQLSLLAAENASFRVVFNKWVLENRSINPQTQETTHIQVSDVDKSFLMESGARAPAAAEGRWIALAPGSVWETKKWPWQHYAGLAKILLQEDHRLLLLGSAAEKRICQDILKELSSHFDGAFVSERVKDVSGEGDLVKAYERLRSAAVLVSNDSGLMHLAAAAGVPTVAIFGPTTLSLGYQPWNRNAIVVQRKMECRPCGAHGHKKCPIGTHACMIEIQPTEVSEAVNQLFTS